MTSTAFVSCGGTGAPQGRRRAVVVSGKRVKTVDVHAHCAVPEALALLGLKIGGPTLRAELDTAAQLAVRLNAMDEQGIDMEALSINPNWYKAERDLAKQVCSLQNQRLAETCAAHPDRFVAFATVPLQHPDLAAELLEEGVKKYNLRGAAIGGSVNGEEISDPRFHPFWAKAEQLGVLVFIHPQATGATAEMEKRFKGNGYLGNVIGNPLETTIALSHLIFEGTLDRYPGLKICGAHAGGYLPSYLGRTDVACDVRANANCVNKKHPREYFRGQILADSMVFSDEGLRHLVAEMGVSQVVYGTDMPYNWPANVDLILNAKFLSDADKEAILGGNLVKLLRLG